MHMIDDATGIRLALIFEEETTEAAMRLLWLWIDKYGIPVALYCDRKNVYLTDREVTVEEALAGEEPLTAFGKACKKMGIQIITAHSPQAKGRVERNHGVYQDRFVKELRLADVSTIVGANKVLEEFFIEEINKKFSKVPKSDKDLHRAVPKGLDLRTVFCWEVQRSVGNDWVIRNSNRFYQILRENRKLPRPGNKVTVCEWLDGSIHILYEGKELRAEEIGAHATRKVAS